MAEELVAQDMKEANFRVTAQCSAPRMDASIEPPRESTVNTHINNVAMTIEMEKNPKIVPWETNYEVPAMQSSLVLPADQESTSLPSAEGPFLSNPLSPAKVRNSADAPQRIFYPVPHSPANIQIPGDFLRGRRADFPLRPTFCSLCGYDHLNITRHCPQNASELELRLMLGADRTPRSRSDAAYRVFLHDQLLDRITWKKNRK